MHFYGIGKPEALKGNLSGYWSRRIDDVNRVYFDDWGGRAYVFSKDVSYEPLRAHYPKEGNLYIDENIFTQMKGKYIFSRVNILNINEYNFEQVGVFSNNTSPYIIYVYKNIGL